MKTRIHTYLSKLNYVSLADVSSKQSRSVSSIVSLLVCMFDKKLKNIPISSKIVIIFPKGDLQQDDDIKTSIYLSATATSKFNDIMLNQNFDITIDGKNVNKSYQLVINAIVIYYRNGFETEGMFNWLMLATSEGKNSQYETWKARNQRIMAERVQSYKAKL